MVEYIRTIKAKVEIEVDTNKRTITETLDLDVETLGALKGQISEKIYDIAEAVSG